MSRRTPISGGTVLTVDPVPGELDRGDVLVEEGRTAAVAPRPDVADYELRMIADSGGTASVSADIEVQMGHGWPATGRLLDAGIRPSLSIDVCTSNADEGLGRETRDHLLDQARADPEIGGARTGGDGIPGSHRAAATTP